jgi:HAD superfamily hydrolase (TIGR01509 family)
VTDATTAPGAGATAQGRAIEVVLFDIGGVLAEWTGPPVMRELTGAASDLDVASRWLMSPWVRRFESGDCSAQEFAEGVVAEWKFPFTPEEFLEKFLTWLGDPFAGAEQMVRETKAHATVGCLSNTNSLAWREVISHWPLTPLFEYRFLSFELGAVKPDREIFELVVEQLPVPPDRVLFLDDNAVNVEGALAAGLRAEQARGVDEARAVLTRYALLSSA